MPYKNIVFVKLYLDLFDGDDRFLFRLTERQQLLYIKLLYLAGKTHNKIPKNLNFIEKKINYQEGGQELTKDIQKIKQVFRRFKETKHWYTFSNFEELRNRLDDGKIGSSQGRPKDTLGNTPNEKENEKENEKARENFERVWKEYPNKVEKAKAWEKFAKTVKSEKDIALLVVALANYKDHLATNNWKRPQQGKTWFNNWRDWIDYKEEVTSGKVKGGATKLQKAGTDKEWEEQLRKSLEKGN